jgi:hypothetical protein
MYENDVHNNLTKPEVKGSLGKPMQRLNDNIELDVNKTDCEVAGSVYLVQ